MCRYQIHGILSYVEQARLLCHLIAISSLHWARYLDSLFVPAPVNGQDVSYRS